MQKLPLIHSSDSVCMVYLWCTLVTRMEALGIYEVTARSHSLLEVKPAIYLLAFTFTDASLTSQFSSDRGRTGVNRHRRGT